MPFGFLRGRDRADYTVPPHEPGAHARAFVDREAEIAAIDERIYDARTWAECDRLLDLRNAIRPARVSVAPGRTT